MYILLYFVLILLLDGTTNRESCPAELVRCRVGSSVQPNLHGGVERQAPHLEAYDRKASLVIGTGDE